MANEGERPPKTFLETHHVRLIGSDGTDLGIVTIAEAMRRASDAGLEVVEVGFENKQTVCKMMNAEQYAQHLRDTQRFVN